MLRSFSKRINWNYKKLKNLVPQFICRAEFSQSGETKMVKYLKQEEASNIDQDLFNKCKFSVDQLMELAGQSCAIAIAKCYPTLKGSKKVLVCCGPGNNGGDGLVCARHLALLGYEPRVYCPKKPKTILQENLLHQCKENDIAVLESVEDFATANEYMLVVDALFGFSFKPPIRNEFIPIIDFLKKTNIPICSIDIPSGWHVETGPSIKDDIKPEMLVSLTAPKLCAKYFNVRLSIVL
ncbi:NAD(P)H-hydrate epimerase isoform X2 [Venturia canescens]|uniref:NAD(P)H-hydrate epimerase isoform X2 n=1 Tax=Venturia canescens TaxID=32260 RepID=UPI001C9C859F|nr:NAD(P)H-hydrate epimerase isoform X2 [Venturia canescens]